MTKPVAVDWNLARYEYGTHGPWETTATCRVGYSLASFEGGDGACCRCTSVMKVITESSHGLNMIPPIIPDEFWSLEGQDPITPSPRQDTEMAVIDSILSNDNAAQNIKSARREQLWGMGFSLYRWLISLFRNL